MNWAAIDISILGPAFLAGILIILTHVPLGQRVLERGIIFLDLAVAQIAALGIIIAYSLHIEPDSWLTQFIALASAISGVLLLNYTDKHWPDFQEAIIGSSFVIASSISILLLASNPHGGEQLKDILVGQILWANYQQLIIVASIYVPIIILWHRFIREASPIYFYLTFAITITISVQLVGVYLVFASLILPALAIKPLKHHKLFFGYVIGLSGYLLGLLLAAIFDLPAGALIVVTLAVLALLVGWVRINKFRT